MMIRRVCDALAQGILVAFPAAALASLDLPPFGIVVCAALGALALFWIVR